MRRLVGILLVGGMLLATAVRAGEDPRATIDKAIKAVGGEAALKKHQSATWDEKGIYYGMGDGLPYTAKLAVQWPGQVRMGGQGGFTMLFDNGKAWVISGDKAEALKGEALENELKSHRAGWTTSLLPLKDKSFTLKAGTEATVDKQPAAVVIV